MVMNRSMVICVIFVVVNIFIPTLREYYEIDMQKGKKRNIKGYSRSVDFYRTSYM
jgi:ribosomal silencing factor RsfS